MPIKSKWHKLWPAPPPPLDDYNHMCTAAVHPLASHVCTVCPVCHACTVCPVCTACTVCPVYRFYHMYRVNLVYCVHHVPCVYRVASYANRLATSVCSAPPVRQRNAPVPPPTNSCVCLTAPSAAARLVQQRCCCCCCCGSEPRLHPGGTPRRGMMHGPAARLPDLPPNNTLMISDISKIACYQNAQKQYRLYRQTSYLTYSHLSIYIYRRAYARTHTHIRWLSLT